MECYRALPETQPITAAAEYEFLKLNFFVACGNIQTGFKLFPYFKRNIFAVSVNLSGRTGDTSLKENEVDFRLCSFDEINFFALLYRSACGTQERISALVC